MGKLRTALLGAAVGALALGMQPAKALFYVFDSTNGGASFTAINPGGAPDTGSQTIGSTNFSSGTISIGTSAFSTNSPGTGASAFTSTEQLTASNSGTAQASIEFAIVDNDFAAPSGGLVDNYITLTNNLGLAANTVTQNACINNNAATPTTANVGTLCAGPGSPNNTPTATLTTTTGTTQLQAHTYTTVSGLADPFTIAEFFTLSLQSGANVTATGSVTLTPPAAVPEPGSLALLAGGPIGLGGACLRRKPQDRKA